MAEQVDFHFYKVTCTIPYTLLFGKITKEYDMLECMKNIKFQELFKEFEEGTKKIIQNIKRIVIFLDPKKHNIENSNFKMTHYTEVYNKITKSIEKISMEENYLKVEPNKDEIKLIFNFSVFVTNCHYLDHTTDHVKKVWLENIKENNKSLYTYEMRSSNFYKGEYLGKDK